MPVQEATQAPAAQMPQPQAQRRTGGQHVSGDVWNSAFKEHSEDRLATFLGWFSIGLGLTETIFPKTLDNLIGAPRHNTLTRTMGLREIAAGIGILATPRPAGWMKARVAGDAVDLGLLISAYGSRRSSALRLTGATAMVAGVTALDVICAKRLSNGAATTMKEAAGQGAIRLQTSIAVNRSPRECYAFWHDFGNLSRFMESLEAVQVTGDKTSHWKAKLPAGKTLEWDAETITDTPDQEIGWRSQPGAELENSGSVRFEPRLAGRGTVVRVTMQYSAPDGIANTIAARPLELFSEHRIREDLRRFKSVIETGEVPTTEGQPSGRKGENA